MSNSSLTSQEKCDNFDPDYLIDHYDSIYYRFVATGELSQLPIKMLDLGTGSGVLAVWAAMKNWSVTAVDVEMKHLDVLKRYLETSDLGLDIKPVNDDALILSKIPDNEYDVVCCKDLLEHVDDFSACISAAYSKLKIGGLAYFSTTNVLCPKQKEYQGVGPYSWYPRWIKDRIRRYAMEHKPEIVHYTDRPALHWFSRYSLKRALKKAGFQKVWCIYDLLHEPKAFSKKTRKFIRYINMIPLGRNLIDLFLPGQWMIAKK